MQLVGLKKIEKFNKIHPQARAALNRWTTLVISNNFCDPVELKQTFNSVDPAFGFYVFDITKNCRLVAYILFPEKSIDVKHVFTHDEYDDWWKDKLKEKRKK